jgi:hypothetical protein
MAVFFLYPHMGFLLWCVETEKDTHAERERERNRERDRERNPDGETEREREHACSVVSSSFYDDKYSH